MLAHLTASSAVGARRSAVVWRCAALLIVLLLALAGCAAEVSEDELGTTGNPTPEGIVESFLIELNQALADPELADPSKRRGLAELLASRFAPSERADQRAVMNSMLAEFAANAQQPAFGTKVVMEVSYSGVEVLSQDGDEALVGLVDGVVTLRWLDASDEVVRERSRALLDVLGVTSGGLPVLRVGSSWYMTER
jgi:hypothetical protein